MSTSTATRTARSTRATDADDAADTGCCQAAAQATTTRESAELLQARAIARHLPALGIPTSRVAAALDPAAQSAVVRVDSPHGLYAMAIPPVGHAFPVLHHGRRIGALDVRRVPATTDSATAAHLALYLRDRAAL
ncbi:hypothetical protein ACIOJE_35155 [Kitasatospora sp. NPDC087861]|uniref:hypothetical protein n=1 Tax=Kitasatospora sp. NPDC087861 TaxID=3364070 RepID=UPI0037FF1395